MVIIYYIGHPKWLTFIHNRRIVARNRVMLDILCSISSHICIFLGNGVHHIESKLKATISLAFFFFLFLLRLLVQKKSTEIGFEWLKFSIISYFKLTGKCYLFYICRRKSRANQWYSTLRQSRLDFFSSYLFILGLTKLNSVSSVPK